MTLHDGAQLCRVRRRVGGQLRTYFAEEFRTKQARREDAEASCGSCAAVVEPVNDTAPDEDRVAGPDFDHLAVDGECHDAGKPIDRLVPIAMIVRYRHASSGRAGHFEHVQTAGAIMLAAQETQLERTDADVFGHGCLSCGWEPAGRAARRILSRKRRTFLAEGEGFEPSI